MTRINWTNQRFRDLAQLAEQQRRDTEAYGRELQHPRPQPSKAQLRQELNELTAGRDMRPWGPWSAWREVIGRHGNVYWERSCSKVGTNQEHGGMG